MTRHRDRGDLATRPRDRRDSAEINDGLPVEDGLAIARAVLEPSVPPTDLKPSTAFWRGASGRLYRAAAHTTVFCPSPQQGVYVLARRDGTGRAVPLFAGVATSATGTLNLAHIRRRAITIGATEVHLCPVTVKGSIFGLRRVARDLRRRFAEATEAA